RRTRRSLARAPGGKPHDRRPCRQRDAAQANGRGETGRIDGRALPLVPSRLAPSLPRTPLVSSVSQGGRMATVQQVGDDSFEREVLKSPTPVLVDFWAPWCGPCRAIAPVVEELAREYDGKLKVVKLNVDDNPQTPSRYGVRGIPNLIVFKGGEVKEQI